MNGFDLPDFYANPVLLTDFYNGSHSKMKINEDWEVSHIYNRAQPMVLFGLNWNVLNILTRKVTMKNVNDAEKVFEKMGLPDGMFPREMWVQVVKDFKGYAPILFEALPDGSWVPKGTPFAQVSNTVKGFGELVTWWEGVFLHSAFASGCATRAYHMRKYLDNNRYPITKFHSFDFRSHHGMESSFWAGLAWALFLKGTDTVHIKQYAPNAEMGSIPASAHKVMQQFDYEMEGYLRAIDATNEYDGKLASIPIDTYSSNRFISKYAYRVLHHALTMTDCKPVYRPDSGDVQAQTKYLYDELKKHGEQAEQNFRVIIGEGVDFERAKIMDYWFKQWGVPAERVAYGIGAGFWKDINRDFLGWAMKTAYSNGDDRMKFSDSPVKQSIPGRVNLIQSVDSQDENSGSQIFNMVVEDFDVSPSGGLYSLVYRWDGKDKKPRTTKQSYDQIHVVALTEVLPNRHLQNDIVLSDNIKAKIEVLRSKYLK